MPTCSAVALELLDIWERLSSRHVSLGTGCACGIGGVTLQLQDFEQDIVDFLLGQAERGKRPDVAAYLKEKALDPDSGKWSVNRLLAALSDAERAATSPSDIPGFLLERLSKTLRSFARLHG